MSQQKNGQKEDNFADNNLIRVVVGCGFTLHPTFLFRDIFEADTQLFMVRNSYVDSLFGV